MNIAAHSYLLVVGAFCTWGILPIYWKLLSGTAPHTLLFCRAAASSIVLFAVLRYRGVLLDSLAGLFRLRTFALLSVSSLLLMLNWFSYLWALNNNQMVAASLAYFISPICTVACGSLFLRERLRPGQGSAVVLILAGIAVRALLQGQMPWLALLIGGSFSAYVVVRKHAGIDPQFALFCELAAMTIPAAWIAACHEPAFFSALSTRSHFEQLLLSGSGLVTVLPLYCFLKGAADLPLKIVGVIQYLAPTLMLFIAVSIYREPFTAADWSSLPLIWLGIFCFLLREKGDGHATA